MALTTEFNDNEESAIILILLNELAARNKKVVQRDALPDVQDSDILPIVRGLTSNRINFGIIKTALNAAVVNASFASITGSPTDNTALVNYIAQEIANNPSVDVLATLLAGLVTNNDSVIQAADTLIIALGKLQAQITANEDAGQIVVTPSGNLTSVNVLAALYELQGDIDNISQAIVIRGNWDASSSTFPGGGTAQTGDAYIVNVAGTVDSVDFGVGDKIIALVDNASTTTFAGNWFKQDNTEETQTASEVPANAISGLTGTEVQTLLESLKTLADDIIVSQSASNLSGAINIITTDNGEPVDIILKEIDLIGDVTSVGFSDISRLKLFVLRFSTGGTSRTVDFGTGFEFDESNNNSTSFTIDANAKATVLGFYDGTNWQATIISKPEGEAADPKLASQDITWGATNTHNVNSGYDAAVFGGTEQDCVHNITNASLTGIHKGLISYDTTTGGNEVTFQKDGVPADVEVVGSANNVATLGTGDYTLFAWSVKKINASKTIIVIIQTDK